MVLEILSLIICFPFLPHAEFLACGAGGRRAQSHCISARAAPRQWASPHGGQRSGPRGPRVLGPDREARAQVKLQMKPLLPLSLLPLTSSHLLLQTTLDLEAD